MKTYIETVFTLTSPLHCAMPSDEGNATQTMKMPLRLGDKTDTIPFFPANDLRGRLRRKAARIMMESLATQGKISADLYTGLTCGAASAQPDNAGLTVEEALRGQGNVYMGLFGGGARLLRSGFAITDLVPITQSTIHAGLVPEHFGETGCPDMGFKLLDKRFMVRVDDLLRALHPDELKSFVGVDETALRQQMTLDAGNSRKAAKKDGEDVKKRDVGNIFEVEHIVPGVKMYARIDFRDWAGQHHVGLMLKSLEALINEQGFGGWSRIGFGRFSVDLDETRLRENGDDIPLFVKEGDEYALHSATSGYIQAAEDAVGKLVIGEMEEFFQPRKKEAA
jgi:CRISPR type IV-associated protein Csf2